ncbi:MAG: Dabb family protein [bacterium]|nr:Dabb family protein [bacterium]
MADTSGPLKHVVLLKFKDETSPELLDELIAGLLALPGKIDVMKYLEWGPDVSVEGLQDGFTHCFITTFDGPAGRDCYLPHEAHQAYADVVLPHIDKILVFDFHPQP